MKEIIKQKHSFEGRTFFIIKNEKLFFIAIAFAKAKEILK